MTSLPVKAEGPPVLAVITGSRDWTDRAAIHGDLTAIEATGRLWAVIEGDARGADRIAGRGWASKARHRGVGWVSFPADWAANGRRAGPVRNRQMLTWALDARDRLDVLPVVLAYPLPGSVGTLDMIAACSKVGLRVIRHGPGVADS